MSEILFEYTDKSPVFITNVNVNKLVNKDKVVVKDLLRLFFTYPLSVPKMVIIKGKNFTIGDIAKIVSAQYKKIYKEEADTTLIKVGRNPKLPANRNQTNGLYGIWGHDLEDLSLYKIAYNDKPAIWLVTAQS